MRRVILLAATIVVAAAGAAAQPPADPRIADIVNAGRLRIGLHLPQFVRDPNSGDIRGHGTGTVIVPIAQALADRMGVTLQLVGHPAPPALMECLKARACDAGFLGFTRNRMADVDYATPHIMVPFTYLVPPGSPIRTVADADRPGVRIAAVRSHASTLALARLIKHAQTIQVAIPDEAFELVRTGRADAYASPRPAILEYVRQLPGARVLDDRYGANIQAIALAKGEAARLAYISAFIEEAKASGLIQRAIDRAGERGIEVMPRGPAPAPEAH